MQVQERLSPALLRLLALLALSVVINYIDRGNLSIAAPLLKDELGLTASQLGILLSSFFWAYAAFMMISGWLADHLDVNWVLAAGFLVWSGATVATGFARGFVALVAVRLVLGAGESVSYPSYSNLLARHFPEHHRGFANAVIATGLGIGPAFGMFAGGMLMARLGWRIVFIGLGLVGLLWLLPWLKWMPRNQAAHGSPTPPTAPSISEILKQQSAWGTCAGLLTINYTWYLVLTWMPFYLVRERHFSMDKMAAIIGAAYLLTAVSAAVSGWLSDRWIASGGSTTLVRKTFMAVGQTGSGILLLLCVLASPAVSIVCLLVAYAFCGVSASNLFAITQTLAGPRASGKWTGFQNGIASLAGVVSTAVTGFVVNRTGHFLWAFVITASVAVVGSLCWVFVVGSVKQVVWAQPRESDLARTAAEAA
jgi:ACS family D-galactonate transporter-like MFS transporter